MHAGVIRRCCRGRIRYWLNHSDRQRLLWDMEFPIDSMIRDWSPKACPNAKLTLRPAESLERSRRAGNGGSASVVGGIGQPVIRRPVRRSGYFRRDGSAVDGSRGSRWFYSRMESFADRSPGCFAIELDGRLLLPQCLHHGRIRQSFPARSDRDDAPGSCPRGDADIGYAGIGGQIRQMGHHGVGG